MALIHVNFFSETLGMSSQLEVVLPQRAAGQIGVGQAEESREIPVLYLLHGSSVRVESDSPITWTLDGEEGPATTCADIEVLPRRLALLA